MDSTLNLNTLANSLPNSNLANAEKDLLNDFKGTFFHPTKFRLLTGLSPFSSTAAALSITTLYRSSRQTSKRAYNAGYVAACQDILSMIQQGVSAGGDHAGENPMSVGRIMDWVEARCDAIKAREEEEDEEEQKEKEKVPQPPQSGPKQPSRTKRQVSLRFGIPSVLSAKQPIRSAPQIVGGLATPNSPPGRTSVHLPTQPSSPSPSSSRPPLPPSHPTGFSLGKRRKESPTPPTVSTIEPVPIDITPAPFTFSNIPTQVEPLSAGAKRRHAVMMMMDSPMTTPPTIPSQTSSSRRRTRSTRSMNASNSAGPPPGVVFPPSDPMEVELEDGRERKRVARR